MSSISKPKIGILGAGPIGLHAALVASYQGFDVILFERGEVAEGVRKWSHVRLFTPFGMNSTQLGRKKVIASGHSLPGEDVLLTGNAYRKLYLKPLSELPVLREAIREQTEVVSVGRGDLLKGEEIGTTGRADQPFRILSRSDSGERINIVDAVLDCTGTFGNHNWLGSGGMPCPGERANAEFIDYELPDPFGLDDEKYFGKSVLLIGSGYSAATTAVALNRLVERVQFTPDRLREVHWMTRNTRSEPITRVPNDSLVERDELAQLANEIAINEKSCITWHPHRSVERIDLNKRERLAVTLSPNEDGESETITVDRIIANVGYRPDRSMTEELQIHECYASHGPMKLAAKLLGETSADCLDQTYHGVDTLLNPEPRFFILGAKSYGRNSNFLMQVGFEQIDVVMEELANDMRSGAASMAQQEQEVG